MNGLKKRLDGTTVWQAEELPNVLWAYRTTPRRSTREAPISLTYGAEAIMSTEVNLCSAWVAGFAPTWNDKLLVECLDLLEEFREAATLRLAGYQQKLAWWYNRGIKTREFSAGDMMLRKEVRNMWVTNAEKLALAWEGPYKVTAIAGVRAYYLEDLDKRPLPQPWNVHNLKNFYH